MYRRRIEDSPVVPLVRLARPGIWSLHIQPAHRSSSVRKDTVHLVIEAQLFLVEDVGLDREVYVREVTQAEFDRMRLQDLFVDRRQLDVEVSSTN